MELVIGIIHVTPLNWDGNEWKWKIYLKFVSYVVCNQEINNADNLQFIKISLLCT
jgi:uncharacterized iron-regulated protein